MTIQTAIDQIDSLKPNMYETQQKVEWLSELDGMVFREILLTHEGVPQGVTFAGYDHESELDTVLLVPEPYSGIYKHYMAAQMDIANRETNEYAKDMALFNNAWQTFADYWNRLHMPIGRARQMRF